MRVLVCGGRKYSNASRLYGILGKLHRERGIEQVINGAASGADALASAWARANDVCVTEYPVDWKREGRAGGPRRNQAMLDNEKPDAVVAFAGGLGTADMVRRARAAGVAIWEIREN